MAKSHKKLDSQSSTSIEEVGEERRDFAGPIRGADPTCGPSTSKKKHGASKEVKKTKKVT